MLLEHTHELIGLVVRQRPEQDAVDDREHGRVRANAQRERKQHSGTECLVLRQHSKSLTNVSPHRLHRAASRLPSRQCPSAPCQRAQSRCAGSETERQTAARNLQASPRARYSFRRATIGSTRTARLAGTRHAMTPMTSVTRIAAAKVIGSVGVVPHSSLRISRLVAKLTATPITRPTATICMPSLST